MIFFFISCIHGPKRDPIREAYYTCLRRWEEECKCKMRVIDDKGTQDFISCSNYIYATYKTYCENLQFWSPSVGIAECNRDCKEKVGWRLPLPKEIDEAYKSCSAVCEKKTYTMPSFGDYAYEGDYDWVLRKSNMPEKCYWPE